MTAADIPSPAFRLAALKSERRRTIAVLGATVALAALLLVRAAAFGFLDGLPITGAMFLLLALMFGYEAAMLRSIRQALQAQTDLPFRKWVANMFVETLFPTAAILIVSHASFMGPYRALASPAILVYVLFIVLSVLRLSPRLARLTGLFSAAGYGAAVLYTFQRFPESSPAGAAFPLPVYLTFAALLLIAGAVAGEVTGQIRTHVEAALREAETRRQVEHLRHDLDVARSIQQGLLPGAPPRIDGFELAGWNQPADQTGGDYYDWLPLGDGRVVVTLADVTGHGIGPALVMSACRAYTRAGLLAGLGLRELLAEVSQLLFEDLPPERFVTLAAAVLQPRRPDVELLSAGQGPVLKYSRAGDCFDRHNAHGVPLGLLPRMKYSPPETLALEPADLLIMITDGFFEWTNAAGEDFGIERIEEAIRAGRDLPPSQIIGAMHAALLQFVGSVPQQDDLTAVVVKRL